MAIKGIQSNERQEYICKDDPCTSKEDGATVFYHEPVPNAIMARISDQVQTASMNYGDMQTQTFQQRTSHRNRECFRFGVKGWDNFFMGNGEPIPFETEMHMEGGETYQVVSRKTMNMILLNTIQEVGGEIWSSNTMTETQRKNFEAWSSRLGASTTSDAGTADQKAEQSGGASDQPNAPTEEVDLSTLPPGAAILHNPTTATHTGRTPEPENGRTGAPAG